MKPYYANAGIAIYHGDARELVPEFMAETDVIVTDPPAGRVGTLPDTLLPTTVGVAQVAPPLGDPQLAVTPVIAAGTLSAQVVPSAALGPTFDTRSV